MRIAVHDYAGHIFQVELSLALARRGHTVSHFYFAGDGGPKGAMELGDDAPAGLSIEPVSIKAAYSKKDLFRRRAGDIAYGREAARRIADFAPDVVISGNTPIDAQEHILRASHRVGAAFLYWMQDFYSLAMERLLAKRLFGLGTLVGEFYKLREKRQLAASDGVVLIGEDFRGALQQFGVPEGKISVIENWGALDSIPCRPKSNQWSREHGLSGKFVFLYSGTLALKHNPDLLWDLSTAFEHQPDVAVVVAAAGVSRDALELKAKSAGRSNLIFLPLQPAAVFPDVLGSADVLVALLEGDAAEFSVPSKVLSYLCAGRPILLSAPRGNLAARLVERAGAGMVASGGDRGAFLAAAERLRQDEHLRALCADRGRQFAEETFPIENVTARFEAAFVAAAARRRRRGAAVRSGGYHSAGAVAHGETGSKS